MHQKIYMYNAKKKHGMKNSTYMKLHKKFFFQQRKMLKIKYSKMLKTITFACWDFDLWLFFLTFFLFSESATVLCFSYFSFSISSVLYVYYNYKWHDHSFFTKAVRDRALILHLMPSNEERGSNVKGNMDTKYLKREGITHK